MPTPAVSLKLKKFRRRFGIAAPRVAVRPHLPWHWYAVGMIGGGVMLAAMVWSVAQQGEAVSVKRELEQSQLRLLAVEDELMRFRSASGTEQNAVQLERVVQQQLMNRVKVLESENAGLKEEIALFERLVPQADGSESVVRIERLRVMKDIESGKYRYRLLLGFQSGRQGREFKGRLQLRIQFFLAGKDQQMVLPSGKDSAVDYLLETRHFLRKEGVLVLPPEASLKGLEALVFQGDTLKARASAQF